MLGRYTLYCVVGLCAECESGRRLPFPATRAVLPGVQGCLDATSAAASATTPASASQRSPGQSEMSE